MTDLKRNLKEGLMLAATVLTVAIAVPLLVLVAVLGRPILLAAAVIAVVGGLGAALASPRFRVWLEQATEAEVRHKGLRFPSDLVLHPSHAWARLEGEAVVGADDLAQTALGPVESVDLPQPGQHVAQGEALFRLHRGDRQLTIPSPVSGVVESTNEALRSDPGMVNHWPYGGGWIARLRPESLRRDLRTLHRGRDAREWFRYEVDRFLDLLLAAEPQPSLPDGGALVDDLYRHLDDEAWERVSSELFDPRREG